MEEINYFSYDEAATRYKNGRPDFHKIVIAKIKEILRVKEKYDLVLDVACGTGLLTKALLEISHKVIGLDNSNSMLNNAYLNERIIYQFGSAENLEIFTTKFDLVTVSSAFHWLKQRIFLESLRLVLNKGNHLVLHNNFFTGKCKDNLSDKFENWVKSIYLSKFKSPKRNKYAIREEELEKLGFRKVHYEEFDNIVEMNKEELRDYLITQSNIISNVELGNININDIKKWIDGELKIQFNEMKSRNFVFRNTLTILKLEK